MFKILEHGSDVMFEIYFSDTKSFFEQLTQAFRAIMIDAPPKGTMISKTFSIKESDDISTNAIRFLNELIFTFDIEWLIPLKGIEITNQGEFLELNLSMERIRDPGSIINVPKAATYSGTMKDKNNSPLKFIIDI